MRSEMLLINQWQFARLLQPVKNPDVLKQSEWTKVDLPHVWNQDIPSESGCCLYQTVFDAELKCGKEYFLAFDAVGGVARIFLNGMFLGEHRGSYSRFCVEAGTALREGENLLQVLADNTRYEDVNPLMGDFTYYGGIFRPVMLIETDAVHFDLMYYGTSGVEIAACGDGTVTLKARVVHGGGCELRYEIFDKEGELAAKTLVSADEAKAVLTVKAQHLWNGKEDPYLYRCTASLWKKNELCDSVSLDFGFRSIAITADKGFFLNGRHLKLHGVAKHQDFADMGCAVGKEQQELDMTLIQEIGANAVRLSHYQHPQHTYDLCDQTGMVVWAEIPMLAMPDGNDGILENARQQMTELILQNLHHPSICFWGVQNEIAMRGESVETYSKVQQLDELVKQLDPHRISAAANLYSVKNNSRLNFLNDAVGYNLYFGWYYGTLTDYAPFFKKFHLDNPGIALGITEYGVDCNLEFHTDKPECKDYTEEFQCKFHEAAYSAIVADDALWGSFVWNMFDFSSAVRDEGGVKSLNSKGLVTYDRKTRKDSFYYYKACWSQEPFVHLTGRRYQNRCGETTTVKIYSNQPAVTLMINDRIFETRKGEHVFEFKHIPLQKEMILTAVAGSCSDTIILYRVSVSCKNYEYSKKNDGRMVSNWFEKVLGDEKDLFLECCYSVNDSIGELLSNPNVYALLKIELPEIACDDRTRMYGGMSLLRVLDWNAGLYSEEKLKNFNKKLNKIRKENMG